MSQLDKKRIFLSSDFLMFSDDKEQTYIAESFMKPISFPEGGVRALVNHKTRFDGVVFYEREPDTLSCLQPRDYGFDDYVIMYQGNEQKGYLLTWAKF